MNANKFGKVQRTGNFLYQLDDDSGSGINVWSCSVQPNNGYQDEHALKMAMLFECAPDLLEALQLLHDNLAEYQQINKIGGYDNHDMRMARYAIARATQN